MTFIDSARGIARAGACACMLALAACGQLFEERAPDRREQLTGYIDRLNLDGDWRLDSLRSYGMSLARVLDGDITDRRGFHDAVVRLNQDQACLTISWGWRAIEHREALERMFAVHPTSNPTYIEYLRESSTIPASTENPCMEKA